MEIIAVMSKHRRLIRICARASIVALVVGTLLNLINQGDAVFGGGDVDYLKLALTYLVPFLVSTHGAMTAPAAAGPA